MWISHKPLTTLAGGIVAALFACYNLPPSHAFVVAAPYRLDYGLFVGTCGLIGLYRPARSLLRPTRPSFRFLPNLSVSGGAYTEASLPTIATVDELALATRAYAVEGTELYRWVRTCANLSDLLWNAEAKLQAGDTRYVRLFLQEAHKVAVSLRQDIREVGERTPLPPAPSTPPLNKDAGEQQGHERIGGLPEIYFLHIPKTAGSSLNILLHNVYPPEQCMAHYTWRELLALSRKEISQYRCYTGHFGTGLYSLLDRDLPTVTLLRDPFERCISQIKHTERVEQRSGLRRLSGGRRYLRKLYLFLWENTRNPALRRRLEARYVTPLLYEHQTLSLGLEIDAASLQGIRARSRYREHLHGLPPAQDMDAILERAKCRLDSMVVVGTAERFAQSLELICDYLDVPAPPALPKTNVGPGHDIGFCYRTSGQISPAMAARIDEITRYDRELYAYANRLLDAQWEQYQRRRSRSNPGR